MLFFFRVGIFTAFFALIKHSLFNYRQQQQSNRCDERRTEYYNNHHKRYGSARKSFFNRYGRRRLGFVSAVVVFKRLYSLFRVFKHRKIRYESGLFFVRNLIERAARCHYLFFVRKRNVFGNVVYKRYYVSRNVVGNHRSYNLEIEIVVYNIRIVANAVFRISHCKVAGYSHIAYKVIVEQHVFRRREIFLSIFAARHAERVSAVGNVFGIDFVHIRFVVFGFEHGRVYATEVHNAQIFARRESRMPNRF